MKMYEQKNEAEKKAKFEKNELKRKVILESDEDDECTTNDMNDHETDSEWEDDEETNKTPEYNTLKLPNFSRECDHYKIKNRAAAKLGNGLLKDLKLVSKKNTKLLLCPNKIQRERLKWGSV